MTNANRVKRGFVRDPSYAMCGSNEEDTGHVPMGLPEAQVVWHYFIGKGLALEGMNEDYRKWIMENIKDKTQDGRLADKIYDYSLVALEVEKYTLF